MRPREIVLFSRGADRYVPDRVYADAHGFALICRVHEALRSLRETDVILDLQGISYLDGHLTPALQIIHVHALAAGNTIALKNVAPTLRDIFCRNGFLQHSKKDSFNTVMPITTFPTDGGKEFAMYARKYLARKEMPRMAPSLRSKFFEGVGELFENAAMHSQTDRPIIVGGQFYPRANRIAISIVDSGAGMHRAVTQRIGRRMTAHDAIEWAMEPYNTTKSGDVPGGLGSLILREFIGRNNGKITVVSNDGFWRQHGMRTAKRSLANPFPGTAVVLEINSADTQSYSLAPAPDPYNIW